MMSDLAMHTLELLENSIQADATLIEVTLRQNIDENKTTICVKDDGCGMDEKMVQCVADPFTTKRTSRKVGLGVSFLKQLTDLCNGSLTIESKINCGTTITATMQYDHIDVPPLGDLGEMMMIAMHGNPKIDYVFTYQFGANKFIFKSKEVKDILGCTSIDDPEVLLWIKEYINQEVECMKEGVK